MFKGEVLEHDPMAQDKRWALEATGPAGDGDRRDRPRAPRRDRPAPEAQA